MSSTLPAPDRVSADWPTLDSVDALVALLGALAFESADYGRSDQAAMTRNKGGGFSRYVDDHVTSPMSDGIPPFMLLHQGKPALLGKAQGRPTSMGDAGSDSVRL